MKKQFLLTAVLAFQLSGVFAADIQAGQTTFASKCASCHSVGPSARSYFAPQLNGIVGRRAGASKDFKYSPAMKKSGIVWTEKNLAAFLDDPSDLVPGTSMRFWGMSNEKQVANLLAYLRTFK
jgi:cytochrome c